MTNGDRVVTFRWYWCGCRPVSVNEVFDCRTSSVPPTVKLPSLVKKSSAAEPESVSSVSVGASGAVVSRVNVSSLLPDVLPAASV
ncbi:hypothetical protein ITG08_18960 [Vibrio cyclitrophicus]|uniref:hypothetical protein n=1 Tax=Vibrio cyclitrophicus TaxID=47951 RepID=UPI00204A6BC8|nr:hypothetical protein [Vibrio cyclitrophicus]UPR28097.1 hypothetical protein ITG08_18850 [Vibrio cyclitrophicus]UPR28105.1 hypothetical protein ITG08_18890 [Vibrio cyclitrophicus]UPR28109.1 hypothetical protein ITG08_18910 [Vibrio cyclitrophicus]UPR28119.1 hypothetical protein ITG08_18960 [Vibrio cyclitrophicus]